MATCTTCGRDAGFMMSQCPDCIERDRQGAAKRAAAQEALDTLVAEALTRPVFTADCVGAGSTIPGRTVTAGLGVVRGVARAYIGQISALGASGRDSAAIERTCDEAYHRLLFEAAGRGADGVTDVRYELAYGSPDELTVLCTGQAVRLAPAGGAGPQ